MYKYSINKGAENPLLLVKEQYLGDQKIEGAKDIVKIMCDTFHLQKQITEYVYLICLNVKGKIMGIFEVAHGGYSSCFIDKKTVFTAILLCNASHFILVHNHPSGECFPSKEDHLLTTSVQEAGKLLDIIMTDHIIIGDRINYYSFKEKNNLS